MADSVTRALLIQEAERRGWQVGAVGAKDYFCKITLPDGRWELFRGSRPMRSAANGVMLAKDKQLTMDFVQSLGYEVPSYLLTDSTEEAIQFLQNKKLIVVKPVDGESSRGVTVGIDTEEKLLAAIQYARTFTKTSKIMFQQQLQGSLYRLFVLDGKLVATALRKAAFVTGDGVSTVRALIEALNTDPRRGKGTESPLRKIDLPNVALYLGEGELARVLSAGEVLRVSSMDSISDGGEATNVSETVHPDWHHVTTSIAKEAGLFVCGYDIMCNDISQPMPSGALPLIEINSCPGLRLHEFPTAGGEPVRLAPLIYDALFA